MALLRLLILVLIIIAVSVAGAWVASNDGTISIQWLGWQIQMHLLFAIAISVLLFLLLFMFIQIILGIFGLPSFFKRKRQKKSVELSFDLLTKGLSAIALSDKKSAKRYSQKLLAQSQQHEGLKPLAHLVATRSAELADDQKEAQRHLQKLSEFSNTKALAITGLQKHARKNGDTESILRLANEASKIHPKARHSIKSMIEAHQLTGDWIKVLQLVNKQSSPLNVGKQLNNEEISHIKADALYMLAMQYSANGTTKNSKALSYATTAFNLDKVREDIAELAIKLLLLSGKTAKARDILAQSWAMYPRLDLLNLYLIKEGLGAVKEIKFTKKLLDINPGSAISHVALAKSALKKPDIALARNHAETAVELEKTSQTCELMADIERKAVTIGEDGSEQEVEHWQKQAESLRKLAEL